MCIQLPTSRIASYRSRHYTAMLATQLCSRTVSVSKRCLQQLLFSSPRCLCPSLAAARQLRTSRSSCQATGTAGQQSTDGQVAAADTSVLDTVKLLEAGIGPLSQHPMVLPPQPRVVVISGPSGVGKDAVIKRLQELRPDLYFVVTATSRAMRPGEVEGKDYFFVSKATFESWIASGQLLEHALVYGEYKGIPRQQVDAALMQGSDVVLRIDVQGADTVRRLMPGVISVFIVAESEAQLVARLVSRKTEPMDKMITRVKTARDETQHIHKFDYVVVNREGQLDDCVAQLCAIIDAEKLRTKQQQS